MDFDVVGLTNFYGGQSEDIQLGAKAQYWYARHADTRKKPTNFTVLPGTAKTSAAIVTDLVLDMCQLPSGAKYAVGDSGNVYGVSINALWSLQGKLPEISGNGLLYRSDVDIAYISGQTGLARIKLVSTAPVFEGNFFQRGRTTTSTCYMTGGTNTYATPTTIKEDTVDMRTFISDIEPFYSIKIKVVSKGSGNLTLTLHDDANNLLSATTVTNATLTNNALNEFVFATPIRALISPNGRTYHFHVTSTVADATIQTTTVNSLQDCDMELWANALVTTKSTLHPIYQFANLTLIGNERYVAVYEPLQDQPTTTDYSRHRLTFPPGYETIGFAQLDLYVAVGAAKYSTTGEFQEGKIFLWDGVQTTYNRYWDVPEGAPESIFSEKNIISFISGGALYKSAGSQPVKVRTFRNTDSEYSGASDITRAPVHGMTVRRGVLLMAYPFSTSNTSLEHGVYAYGAISSRYPDSWTFNYTMSTGSVLNNGTNNLRVGMVKNYGDTLYISWRDDSKSPSYGVDIVNNLSAPASDFELQCLQFLPTPYHPKSGDKVIATFDPLPVGCQVRAKYMLDNSGTWTYGNYVTTGATFAIVDVANKEFNGIQFGIEGIVGATTPVINYIGLTFDPRKQAVIYGP